MATTTIDPTTLREGCAGAFGRDVYNQFVAAKADITALSKQITLTGQVLGTSASAKVLYFNASAGMTITRIDATTDAALTTGNATLTAAIGTTNITGGAITFTQAASAAATTFSVSPSALNVATTGQVIKVTVGGTNDAANNFFVTIYATLT